MNAMQPPQSIEEIKAGLETTEKGGVRQSIRNCLTVFQRDPLLSGAIAYNILTDRKDIIKPIGFYRESTALNDTDMKYLLLYLEDVCKISIFHHNCAEDMVSQEFVDKWSKTMNIAVSGKCWLDCTNQGGNKGSALQHFQEAYKISPDETLAFGDNINDIEMLKRASHSFAVENAREEVKEAANFIAPSYKEDGVLQVLKAVLRGELA